MLLVSCILIEFMLIKFLVYPMLWTDGIDYFYVSGLHVALDLTWTSSMQMVLNHYFLHVYVLFNRFHS